MKLNLLGILAFLIFATSCDTKIEGKIIDNFDKNVSSVNVKISNSAYESLSNEDGSFDITFSPGKFELMFEKENHVIEKRTLEVIDAKDYPMGTITMTRLPDTNGVFVKGIDDYIRLEQIELNEIQGKYQKTMLFPKKKINYYLKEGEVIPVIKLPKGKVEIYDNVLDKLFIFKANDKEVVKTLLGYNGASFRKDNIIDQDMSKVKEGVIKRVFQFEEEGIYVLIKMKGNEFSFRFSKEAYAFQIVS